MEFRGLSKEEVSERIARGEINKTEDAVSRSYRDIIVKNVFTVFNLILAVLGIALICLGKPLDAIASVGVITLNVLIATIQEMKAKHRLDSIALLMRPKATVMRDGEEIILDQSQIVKDDIIKLSTGDQCLVDGTLLAQKSIEMDESLLTGESRTIRKNVNDFIYSGSYCISGEGYYVVTAFGNDTFAAKMLASAKKFKNKYTPLQRETESVTKLLIAFAIAAFILLIPIVMVRTGDFTHINNIITQVAQFGIIAIDIVPLALFLLITITYMIAALRMANGGVLLQKSNSVESICHIDTICMDKTGTITTNKLVFDSMAPIIDEQTARTYISMFTTATSSRNRTVEALAAEFGKVDTILIDEIMFSSERKFSAVTVEYEGEIVTLYMGAPEVLYKNLDNANYSSILDEYTQKGLRAVTIAKGERFGNDMSIPNIEPVAIVAIRDEIRPECKETIDLFLSQGIDLKVISGDNPAMVNAMFSIAGIPGERKIMSGSEMDSLSEHEMTRRILETNIFGRMKPEHKETIIRTLKDNGRYVAMVGDGVNDVRSLKEANVGIALQSGSGAARAVADMVLVQDSFAALPKAVKEGKKTVSGMRDILRAYLSRNFVIAFLLILLATAFGTMPFLPVPAMFYAVSTLSIAAFFMAIWAQATDARGSIIPTVLRFSIPSAMMIALFAFAIYSGICLAGECGLIDFSHFGPFLEAFKCGGENVYQMVARNVMYVFILLSGVMQLLLVTPYFKIFSIDGDLHKDVRPTILAFLLLGLIILAFVIISLVPQLATLSQILPLDWYYYVMGVVAAVLWFFVSRFVHRKQWLHPVADAFRKLMKKEKEMSDN